ncbi:coiled-coil domain-containing protein, partial [Lysinibacillus capsici]|uniref:coiled-coil domain-containing protein n=1 Tax=Lysinibacillus capsici TaxID=2115968 RepID=UPI0011BE9546
MFKFHMILFLLGKGFDINDVAEWQGLISASSKPRMTRTTLSHNDTDTSSFENQEMIIQLVGRFVEAVKELQSDNVNFMEKLVDFNEEAATREINAMLTHLESKNNDIEKTKEHMTYLKENVLQPLIKREWSINEKIAKYNSNSDVSTSAPVKKSFFQKLFGGGEVTSVENKVESLQELQEEQQTLLIEINNTNTEVEKLQVYAENAIKEAGELQALIAHIKEQKVDRIADLKAEIPTIDSLPLLNTLINASNRISEPYM